uniref:Uncharacterized protein n=1 Tax=Romanomermis culicivorax TaxID=13658 RepID=A0A915IRG7_ROMCU
MLEKYSENDNIYASRRLCVYLPPLNLSSIIRARFYSFLELTLGSGRYRDYCLVTRSGIDPD